MFTNLVIPVIRETVESLLTRQDWSVDVYLVLGFEMDDQTETALRDSLPFGVGLEIWNDAIPLGYFCAFAIPQFFLHNVFYMVSFIAMIYVCIDSYRKGVKAVLPFIIGFGFVILANLLYVLQPWLVWFVQLLQLKGL